MNFIPEQTEAQKVPYFEDVSREQGWQGYATTKNLGRLKSEVTDSIQRLGGFVSGFQAGTFRIDDRDRQGFRIFYSIEGRPARLDIAALPVKSRRDDKKKENSLKMALYMLRIGLDGMWFFQQLSPGYAPLMPFMIADNEGHTVSQLWAESSVMNKLLPPPSADFEVIEGTEVAA